MIFPLSCKEITHIPMLYKFSPTLNPLQLFTDHPSCPHAAALLCPRVLSPCYSLNKRALLPDVESPRKLSFDSSARRPRITHTLLISMLEMRKRTSKRSSSFLRSHSVKRIKIQIQVHSISKATRLSGPLFLSRLRSWVIK